MKQFTVPLIDIGFRVHWGNQGVKSWEKATEHEIGDQAGMYSDGHIWVHDLSDSITLSHELSHAIDGIMALIDSQDEEFRAYVGSWVHVTVLEWSYTQ